VPSSQSSPVGSKNSTSTWARYISPSKTLVHSGMLRFTNSREGWRMVDPSGTVVQSGGYRVSQPSSGAGWRATILLALMDCGPRWEESTHQHGPREDPLQYASSTCISGLGDTPVRRQCFPLAGSDYALFRATRQNIGGPRSVPQTVIVRNTWTSRTSKTDFGDNSPH
jgi:hypothetical protein